MANRRGELEYTRRNLLFEIHKQIIVQHKMTNIFHQRSQTYIEIIKQLKIINHMFILYYSYIKQHKLSIYLLHTEK
jgi:hypothetical protein